MRRLFLTIGVLCVCVRAASAEPIYFPQSHALVEFDTSSPITTWNVGSSLCAATFDGACIEYNVVSGSGTVQLSLYTNINNLPVFIDGAQVATTGLNVYEVESPVPLPNLLGLVNLQFTGDLAFDYVAITFLHTLRDSTFVSQTWSLGVRPDTIPTPEPSGLALLLTAAAVGLALSRRLMLLA